MKASEIRELTEKELEEKIEEETAVLIKQKMTHAISNLDNPVKLKESRKNVARLKTELRQRIINQQKES